MQDFLVAWTSLTNEEERYSNFETLAEAERFITDLDADGFHYVYLTIVIRKQQIYSVHWRIVGIVKSTNYQENDLT